MVTGCIFSRAHGVAARILISGKPAVSSVYRRGAIRGLTLVEVAVSLALLAAFMICFLATFVQSRRLSEARLLPAPCRSLIYGLIEQMKGLDYPTLLPSHNVDADAPADVRDL